MVPFFFARAPLSTSLIIAYMHLLASEKKQGVGLGRASLGDSMCTVRAGQLLRRIGGSVLYVLWALRVIGLFMVWNMEDLLYFLG